MIVDFVKSLVSPIFFKIIIIISKSPYIEY